MKIGAIVSDFEMKIHPAAARRLLAGVDVEYNGASTSVLLCVIWYFSSFAAAFAAWASTDSANDWSWSVDVLTKHTQSLHHLLFI